MPNPNNLALNLKPETLALTSNPKYLERWTFIRKTGGKLEENRRKTQGKQKKIKKNGRKTRKTQGKYKENTRKTAGKQRKTEVKRKKNTRKTEYFMQFNTLNLEPRSGSIPNPGTRCEGVPHRRLQPSPENQLGIFFSSVHFLPLTSPLELWEGSQSKLRQAGKAVDVRQCAPSSLWTPSLLLLSTLSLLFYAV